MSQLFSVLLWGSKNRVLIVSKAAHFCGLAQVSTLCHRNCPTPWTMFSSSVASHHRVFNPGPQFTPWVLTEFCAELRARVSLSSGFQPQTNGQTEHDSQELLHNLKYVCKHRKLCELEGVTFRGVPGLAFSF